jgi:hypothetical protein
MLESSAIQRADPYREGGSEAKNRFRGSVFNTEIAALSACHEKNCSTPSCTCLSVAMLFGYIVTGDPVR